MPEDLYVGRSSGTGRRGVVQAEAVGRLSRDGHYGGAHGPPHRRGWARSGGLESDGTKRCPPPDRDGGQPGGLGARGRCRDLHAELRPNLRRGSHRPEPERSTARHLGVVRVRVARGELERGTERVANRQPEEAPSGTIDQCGIPRLTRQGRSASPTAAGCEEWRPGRSVSTPCRQSDPGNAGRQRASRV